jgi:hypothetical protein
VTLCNLPLHVIMVQGSWAYIPHYTSMEGKLLWVAPGGMVVVHLLWSEEPGQITVPVHHILLKHPISTPKPQSVSHVIITGLMKGQNQMVVKVNDGDRVLVKGKGGQQEEYPKNHLSLSNQLKKV